MSPFSPTYSKGRFEVEHSGGDVGQCLTDHEGGLVTRERFGQLALAPKDFTDTKV
jgi:hypothetical protein